MSLFEFALRHKVYDLQSIHNTHTPRKVWKSGVIAIETIQCRSGVNWRVSEHCTLAHCKHLWVSSVSSVSSQVANLWCKLAFIVQAVLHTDSVTVKQRQRKNIRTGVGEPKVTLTIISENTAVQTLRINPQMKRGNVKTNRGAIS